MGEHPRGPRYYQLAIVRFLGWAPDPYRRQPLSRGFRKGNIAHHRLVQVRQSHHIHEKAKTKKRHKT